MAGINLYHGDCMEFMSDKPDNYYELAICDPEYGIGVSKNGYSLMGETGKRLAKRKNYGVKNWDEKIPDKGYFIELLRVSKNQIIWGGNYFIEYLKNTSCFIVWDKNNNSFNTADCELAWTSFNTSVRKYKYTWNGMIQEDMKNKEHRIHPTQKPTSLYKWLLINYAKEGDRILDTHLGSMSIAIACHDMNFDLDGCELDEDYYKAGVKRFNNHISQLQIFHDNPTHEQLKIL